MSRVTLPPVVPLLVFSGLYLISLGCGGSLPGNVPLPVPSNGSAGAASVSISPKTAALGAGNSLQFTATSSGLPTADLEWLADGVPGGNSASGTISRSGLYTAPQQLASNAEIVIAVSSKTAPAKGSTATVTVMPGLTPITVSLAPGVASLYISQAQQFTATVKGTTNQGINWFVNGNQGGNSSVGTISSTGTYTAPVSAPTAPSVTITAASKYDAASSATAAVTILSAPAGTSSGTGAPGTAYYVDASAGNDSNNGQSPTTAWRTIAKVNASSFSPGNSILFKSGDTWREQLNIKNSGSSGNPITFGSYGSGNAPIISGADLLTSFTSCSGYYCASVSTQPNQVFRDGSRLTPVSAENQLATGDWWWNSTTSTVYVYDNPSGHTIEASQRNYAVYGFLRSYVTISGLQTQMAQQYGIYEFGTGTTGLTFTGILTQNNYTSGLRVEQASNTIVTQSTAAYNGDDGFSFADAPAPLVDHVIAHHNGQFSNYCCDAGIKFDASAYGNGANATVQYSASYSNGLSTNTNVVQGIWADTVGDGVTFQYNLVHDNLQAGLTPEADSNSKILYNVVYNNGVGNSYGSGIGLTSGNGANSGNLVYGNTVYNNGRGIVVYGDSGTGHCSNNQIINNISVGNTGYNLAAYNGGNNDGKMGSGNVYSYNALGPAASNFIQWGSNYSTYSSWETATGNCGTAGCSHSVESDPQLNNPSGGNFALQAGSPAIDAGTNLGSAYQFGLDPRTSFAWGTLNQNSLGSGWGIGAFVFVPQISPAPQTSLSVPVK
jgi:hypothetical protein